MQVSHHKLETNAVSYQLVDEPSSRQQSDEESMAIREA
jgi:hypothetical protein